MRLKAIKHVLLFTLLLLSSRTFGQDTLSNANDPYPEAATNSFPELEQSATVGALPLTRLEFQLSLYVLAFGILIILLEIYLIRSKNISAEDTIKFVIITVIIVSTLFLITAGYDNDQIAPAMGLLGTIAGYLLGRISSPKKNENESS